MLRPRMTCPQEASKSRDLEEKGLAMRLVSPFRKEKANKFSLKEKENVTKEQQSFWPWHVEMIKT